MPLPLLLPAAAAAGTLAATAYLDARLGLGYDISLLRSYGHAAYAAISAERRGRLSPFYELEALAQSPKTADDVFLLLPSYHHNPSHPSTTTTAAAPAADQQNTTTTSNNGDITLTRWTYRQLHTAAQRHAAYLRRAHGVRPGEVVALDMANGARFVIAWFAVWALGAVPAFINCHLRGAALLHCVGVSTARLVLVEEEELVGAGKYAVGGEVAAALAKGEFVGEGQVRRVVEVVGLGGRLDEVLEREEGGTTGLPKPAVVSWDVLYTCMPLYHTSASMLALLSTLFSQTTLALGRRFSATRILHELHATRATHLQYVGETLRYLLSTPANPALDSTHRVHTIFGNGLRPDVWQRFVTRFNIRTVAEFYAATEGPGGMWNKSCNGFSAGAVGRNGWLSEALIWGRFQACVAVDAATGAAYRDPRDGRCVRVPAGTAGELLYKLDPDDVCRRFQGYFNDEGATNKKVLRDVFEPGDAWFATGDVLRRCEKGRCWWFVDRLGDTFRWKSENVAVYGVLVPGQDGRAGCAAVVLREGGSSDERTQLSRVTSALAVTGTNKPQKHLLQKDGIDPEVVEVKGDRIYWLRDGKYERFGKKEYERLQGGGVKL
ncbi:AMP-dependent synthetase/ligase [Lasiodiplodia theobromae]|uniref:AMP-dependent synthetase/ligase n=1 Tax=Lasiodiplodia theobromae TaxID=45133 RepID=UPI0015C327C0|nr:AMP-dependent synthetase/ligase [Lasiodiplodia theobromae]KAF4540822.1 AMP-dependent synthetase/ligase [Lasiodiplodia theobromae]